MKTDPTRVAARFMEAIKEKMVSEGGKKYTIDTKEFSRFLRERLKVHPGKIGPYLREEQKVPDRYLLEMQRSYGAVVKGLRDPNKPRTPRKPRLPVIEDLWDKLVEGVQKSQKGQGQDVGEFYLQVSDGSTMEDHLQTVAFDMASSFEWSLNPKAEEALKLFKKVVASGEYKKMNPSERWFLRERMRTLQEIAADSWHHEVSTAWERLKRNPKELARLDAIRAGFKRY